MRRSRSQLVAASVLLVAAACTDTPKSRTASLTAPDERSLTKSGNRSTPTAPSPLRVTATTSYSVSLAWNPSTDKSGPFTYHPLSSGGGAELVLPQTQTTATWTTAVFPRNRYVFLVCAVDAAGNRPLTATARRQGCPPIRGRRPTPVLTAAAIGATYVTLSANATDDGPIRYYLIFENGRQVGLQQPGQGVSITSLTPGATHTFTSQAFGGATLVLIVAVLAACYMPARRAAEVDPVRTLAEQ